MQDPIEQEIDRHLQRQEKAMRDYEAAERQVLSSAPTVNEVEMFFHDFPERLLQPVTNALKEKDDADLGHIIREALTTWRIDRALEDE